LWTGPQSFEFRFRKPARHPGRWARGERHLGTGVQCVATLRLHFADRVEGWEFVVDPSRQILRRLVDLDEESMCATLTLRLGQSDLVMSDRFSLWEYIVASGRRFFPATKWHFAYLHAQYHNCAGSMEGKNLRMVLKRERVTFVEFEFFIDDAFAGIVGASRKH
jgi:hypothetical protein